MYLLYHIGNGRNRLQRQRPHKKRAPLPPANVGHRRAGTLSQSHPHLPKKCTVRSVRLRCHQTKFPVKHRPVAQTVQRTPGSPRNARRQQNRPQQCEVSPISFRKVTKEEAESTANRLKLKYLEVSAKTGKKVNDLFDEVL